MFSNSDQSRRSGYIIIFNACFFYIDYSKLWVLLINCLEMRPCMILLMPCQGYVHFFSWILISLTFSILNTFNCNAIVQLFCCTLMLKAIIFFHFVMMVSNLDVVSLPNKCVQFSTVVAVCSIQVTESYLFFLIACCMFQCAYLTNDQRGG